MEKSEEEKTNVEIGNGFSAPEPKRPRRCVQSKLSWLKSPSEEAKAVAGEEEREESEWSGEGDGKKKRKKRKSQARAPRKSPLKNKEARGLSTRNKSKKNCQQLENGETKETTPKKVPSSRNSTCNRSNSKQRLTNKKLDAAKDVDSRNHQPSSDLWLEAKIAAEENLRLSAGKQTHPFFTSRKTAKRLYESQDIQKLKNTYWPGLDGDYVVSCPPIHVPDAPRDDFSALDWRNWSFIETTPLDLNGCCAMENTSSVFVGSVKPFKFDAVCHEVMHRDQLSNNVDDWSMTSAKSTSILSYDCDTNLQLLSNFKMDHASSNSSLPPKCVSWVGGLENGQQDSILKERLASYNQRISCWPDCSLWTNKYQPENAMEVCGNSESVRFLSQWLKSWQERGLRIGKNKKNVVWNDTGDSEDSEYDIESDMDDMDDEFAPKNVLMITGPVGSGKSAAIYACAKEEGFEVIEVNASDLRNGAHIKQKFGEAVESHGFNERSVEDPIVPSRKHIFDSLPGPADNQEDEECGYPSLELASGTCKLNATPTKCSWYATENRSAFCQVANKTLVLFEDVDIVFDEDRGFISSILQLAETAKRPIILTSNKRNPVLPQVLDRSVLDFTVPSTEELLSHLHMICASEKAHVSTNLLEQLIESCLGDIRKTLLLLQFWCQGKRLQISGNTKCSPLPFDINSAHLVIPKLIPWELRCELAEKVGEEIDKTISTVEAKSRLMKAWKQQELNSLDNMDPSNMADIVATPVKARKKTLLKKNHSSLDCTEFLDHPNSLEDFSDTSNFPESIAHRTVKRKSGIVLSSQSDDGSADDLPCIDALNDYQLPDMSTSPISSAHKILKHLNLPVVPIDQSRCDDMIRHPLEFLETLSTTHTREMFNLQDASCVPESSFISGSEANKDFSFVSRVISSYDTSLDFKGPNPVDVNNIERTMLEPSKCLEKTAENTCDVDAESVHGNEELGDSQIEDAEPPSSWYQLTDECSQAPLSMCLKPEQNSVCPLEDDPVQETWKRLRCHSQDLKSCLSTNRKDDSLIVNLASGLTDLMSEADTLLHSCYPLVNDILDPSMTPFTEPDVCSWYEEHFQMGSTYAEHGLCLYTRKCAAVGLKMDCEHTVNLAEEIMACSDNTMTLGKLLIQGKTSQRSNPTTSLDVRNQRDLDSALYDAILSSVPPRLSMVVRNHAFHEYSSFLSQISKLECSRLSQRTEGKKRSRASRHHLMCGPHPLSSEQVELLARRSFTKR